MIETSESIVKDNSLSYSYMACHSSTNMVCAYIIGVVSDGHEGSNVEEEEHNMMCPSWNVCVNSKW